MNLKNERGVIYVATGEVCSTEVVHSVKSLKQSNPNIPVTVYTDKENSLKLVDTKYFEKVEVIDEPQFTWNDKMFGFSETPYEKTVFIDTDTLIWGSIDSLFEGLDYADILALQSPRQFNYDWEKEIYPACITQYNTGVVGFRKSTTGDFIIAWKTMREKRPEGGDQVPFREAVLDTGILIRNIPNEYNCRLGVPQLLVQKVVIAHYGKLHKLSTNIQAKIKHEINNHIGVRCWIPTAETTIRKNSIIDVWRAAILTFFVLLRRIRTKFFKLWSR